MIFSIGQMDWETLDEEEITVSTGAVGFTAAKLSPPGAIGNQLGQVPNICTIQTDQPIRFKFKTAPTNASGFKMAAGDIRTIIGPNDMSAIRFIKDASASADAKLMVQYGRFGSSS